MKIHNTQVCGGPPYVKQLIPTTIMSGLYILLTISHSESTLIIAHLCWNIFEELSHNSLGYWDKIFLLPCHYSIVQISFKYHPNITQYWPWEYPPKFFISLQHFHLPHVWVETKEGISMLEGDGQGNHGKGDRYWMWTGAFCTLLTINHIVTTTL